MAAVSKLRVFAPPRRTEAATIEAALVAALAPRVQLRVSGLRRHTTAEAVASAASAAAGGTPAAAVMVAAVSTVAVVGAAAPAAAVAAAGIVEFLA